MDVAVMEVATIQTAKDEGLPARHGTFDQAVEAFMVDQEVPREVDCLLGRWQMSGSMAAATAATPDSRT